MNIPVHFDSSIGTRGQGYDLGDILNMPVFWAGWSTFQSLPDLSVTASQIPESIAGRYFNCRSDALGAVKDDPLIPHRPRLFATVKEVIAAHPEMQPMISLLQCDSVLCIHVRSGDYGPVSNDFYKTIETISKHFDKIIIFSGVHCNGDKNFIAQNIAKLEQTLARIRALAPNAVFDFNAPDVHVCYMSQARNLLVHTGGFSIIGTLVFSGKQLFITKEFQPHNTQNALWRSLKIPHQLIDNHYKHTNEPTAPSVTRAIPIMRSMQSIKSMPMQRIKTMPMQSIKSMPMQSIKTMPAMRSMPKPMAKPIPKPIPKPMPKPSGRSMQSMPMRLLHE